MKPKFKRREKQKIRKTIEKESDILTAEDLTKRQNDILQKINELFDNPPQTPPDKHGL